MTMTLTVNDNISIHLLSGYYKVVETLIQNGTNVNVEDENGRTPLMMAAQKGIIIMNCMHLNKFNGFCFYAQKLQLKRFT